ncbi:winged helix-turn-helix domain-containing protein [Luteimicrobium subarcticum]|uniref:Winged helix-turn-helix domain-containing protein n=1 Tax=Luteimicrobium subarcticum TaxID=620910 RepID=A0A2M8WWA7_9MICO|nr:crosslink repair DNA glycosylase YcaQ family protein [Luteimicrobium subarcticum]PJI95209.1 hypothetical protein CLV34_0083 [Luteimicrobium subarcticum]
MASRDGASAALPTLSASAARRTALHAQGLARRRPDAAARVTAAGVGRVVDRLQVLQIDSVNVLARAHLVPLYSRLGAYDPALLDRAAGRAPRRVVETWAHQASFVPPSLYPYLGWRREAYAQQAWGSIRSVATTHPQVVEDVRAMVAELGPITASQVQEQIDHPRAERVEWGWNWSVAKRALELLFFTGEVMAARRNAAFERCYDLAERVLPPDVRAVDPFFADRQDEAYRHLLDVSARALGIGTRRTLADYYRLRGPGVDRALGALVEDGVLLPVAVEGVPGTHYRHRDATTPRRAEAATLLSPFDPLVFERTRLEDLFGLRYRIEIYVPAAQRVHGYYVLPFLEGERLTARVDLKADRAAGVLRVEATHPEPWTAAGTADELAAELLRCAAWLGLDRVVVAPRGELAPALAGALR